ncbi:hypothetical protein [Streptomyces sp. NBC_00162]|uniref:hypothetical protein n=1 Tax=Streptomyces sp. NBC_00162 TaxID=2903629 RepID=UPI00214B2A7F|nr:hypothetical protein [Streptomyces sp. NBC_00162]UUU44238.1 hypothetical protein JIW86_39055 [Streptomyces sp. NBC_00162]
MLTPEIYEAVRDDVEASRKETAFNLEAASDADPEANEPLMTAIDSARQRRAQAETEIRRLIAYGREFARPRPYRLTDLGSAEGMSFSGVRTAYGDSEIAWVASATGRQPRQ